MRRRIVAAEREADSEQADHDQIKVRSEHQRHEERHEDHHLDQEHPLAAEAIRQSAEADGADEDAEQGRGADDAVLGRANAELARQERKRDAGHEDDETFEELAGGGERPDQPLHAGHRRRPEVGSIGPHWQFVDVLLNRLCADLRRVVQALRCRPLCDPARRILRTKHSGRGADAMPQVAALQSGP